MNLLKPVREKQYLPPDNQINFCLLEVSTIFSLETDLFGCCSFTEVDSLLFVQIDYGLLIWGQTFEAILKFMQESIRLQITSFSRNFEIKEFHDNFT